MNLYEKMAAITAELGTVAKNLNVQTGKNNSYKAVGERDVLDAVKPLEAKYKVYSYPASRETVESERLESESEYQGKVTKKTTFYTRLKTVYRFVDVENPTDFIETTVFSVGIDSQDKGDGKAMTYADKYALMKGYKISTGDDPDQDASVDTDYKANPKKPAPVSTLPGSVADQAEKYIQREGDVVYSVCADCGGYIYDWKKKDGTVMGVRDYVINSLLEYERPLCRNCIKAAKQK